MFKIFNKINKKRTISLLIIGILAILTIDMMGTINAAYNPSYKVNGDILTINLNPSDSSVGTYSTTLNLGNGKKVNIKIVTASTLIQSGTVYDYLPGGSISRPTYSRDGTDVYVKITTEKLPNISSGSLFGTKINDNSLWYVSSTDTVKNNQIILENAHSKIFSLNRIEINFKDPINSKFKQPDLKVTKVSKKGNYHYVTVKNLGKNSAAKNNLAVYVGKKKIKTLKVNSLGVGKSKDYNVLIPKKHRKVMKSFKIDAFNVVRESNEKNNVLKAR